MMTLLMTLSLEDRVEKGAVFAELRKKPRGSRSHSRRKMMLWRP